MPEWKEALVRLSAQAEEHLDALKHRLRARLGGPGPLQIMPYRGFGTPQTLSLQGRVLVEKDLTHQDYDTVWDNMLAMYRRFESDEVPGIRIRASYRGIERVVVTDEEGYFDVTLSPEVPVPADLLWHEVELEVLEAGDDRAHPRVQATGRVLVPPPRSAFGVISDVDDTILQTHAASFLKMARLTLTGNARTRLPFDGVAALYRALHAGPPPNPLFYVSSSPWNLYDLLIDFMALNDIPPGPLLLRDLGLDRDKFIKASHDEHKREKIERILSTYPALPFILIGDSGQHDPEIYLRVVRDFPGRILAVYIRDVSGSERDAAVQALSEQARTNGVELLLVPDSKAAAEHAAGRGFIPSSAVDGIGDPSAETPGLPS